MRFSYRQDIVGLVYFWVLVFCASSASLVFVSSFRFSPLVFSILQLPIKFNLSKYSAAAHSLSASFWPCFNCSANSNFLVKLESHCFFFFLFFPHVYYSCVFYRIFIGIFISKFVSLLSCNYPGSNAFWLQHRSKRKDFSAQLSCRIWHRLHLFVCLFLHIIITK